MSCRSRSAPSPRQAARTCKTLPAGGFCMYRSGPRPIHADMSPTGHQVFRDSWLCDQYLCPNRLAGRPRPIHAETSGPESFACQFFGKPLLPRYVLPWVEKWCCMSRSGPRPIHAKPSRPEQGPGFLADKDQLCLHRKPAHAGNFVCSGAKPVSKMMRARISFLKHLETDFLREKTLFCA